MNGERRRQLICDSCRNIMREILICRHFVVPCLRLRISLRKTHIKLIIHHHSLHLLVDQSMHPCIFFHSPFSHYKNNGTLRYVLSLSLIGYHSIDQSYFNCSLLFCVLESFADFAMISLFAYLLFLVRRECISHVLLQSMKQ